VFELKHLRRSDTGGHTVTVPSDTDAEDLKNFLNQTVTVRITFPNFADGRGFSLAKRLRLLGYKGRIRAPALMRWKSLRISPSVSLRSNGLSMPTGPTMTTKAVLDALLKRQG